MADQPCVFAPLATRAFADNVAEAMGIALSPLEERDFEDGEHKSRPLQNVRGRDVFVIQSLYQDDRFSVNDKLCRLLFLVGALRDASAARVTAVVPYLAYARKDRKTQERDPVTTRYVASLFEAVGTDRIITLDVHNLAAFQNAFRCRTDHLGAQRLFLEYLAPLLSSGRVAVVSPDPGGVKRAERFRRALSARLSREVGSAFLEKHRALGVVSGDTIVGDVRDREVVIIDDMIGTGETLARAARACRENGAGRIYAAASHGLFVGDANQVLRESPLDRIVVSDTIPPFRLIDEGAKRRVDVVPAAGLFAAAIMAVHTDGSVAELLT